MQDLRQTTEARGSRLHTVHVMQTIERPPSQSQLVYDQLQAAIHNARFSGGSILTESELSRQLGVSTTPVHEAMVRLASEGFLELLPRRGARVVYLSMRDIEEIFEVREGLEAEVIRLALSRLTSEDFEFLDGQLQIGTRAAKRHDYPGFNAADVAVHTRIAEASGNARFVQLVHENRAWIQRISAATVEYGFNMRGRPLRAQEQHVELVAALRRQDPEAERIVRRHISGFKEDILTYMRENGLETI
jgi:DNA-binding GntR family transcriptional regulator